RNGALRELGEIRIDPMDRGFTLGDGLFESVALRGGRPLRLTAHLERLQEGCKVLGIPYPAVDFAQALQALAEADQLQDAVMRILITRGPALRGLLPPKKVMPTILITSNPLPEEKPVTCIVATVTRRNQFSPLARVKSTNYLDNILATQEAAARGA